MIDRALNLLHLHLIWKARGLTNSSDLSPEEVRYRETLMEQRNSLVEKLIEYAVGTQSNTAEGVKRSVRAHALSSNKI
jgi:cohesin complex subunit SA-1/2